jgi:hypothetical protein
VCVSVSCGCQLRYGGVLQQYLEALRAVIANDVIPVEYGGANTMGKCYESSEEVGLRLLAKQNQASAT